MTCLPIVSFETSQRLKEELENPLSPDVAEQIKRIAEENPVFVEVLALLSETTDNPAPTAQIAVYLCRLLEMESEIPEFITLTA